MNHYRLAAEQLGLPFPAFAFPAHDLDVVGGPAANNLLPFSTLAAGTVQIPHSTLGADLHDELAVSLHLNTIDSDEGRFVEYAFPDAHGTWADEVHATGELLVCATTRDFGMAPTISDALADSWWGRATLVLRLRDGGVGTRGADPH